MHLFLSFNDDTIIELNFSDVFFKNNSLIFVSSSDDKLNSVLISDLHYFSISPVA